MCDIRYNRVYRVDGRTYDLSGVIGYGSNFFGGYSCILTKLLYLYFSFVTYGFAYDQICQGLAKYGWRISYRFYLEV